MKRFRTWIGRRVTSLGVISGLGVTVALVVWIRCGPLPEGLLDDDVQPSTLIVDRNGETLYEARSSAGLRGSEFDAAHMPPVLVHATMAAEDTRFLWHVGIDPVAIARATLRNLRAGAVVEGGSTISQQVAKLLLLRRSAKAAHGWLAKLREAVIAVRLEHHLTKNELVAIYLSLAPYGNQIQGAERAARAYFGRRATSLTAAEAAFIAALPQQPSRFNPWRTPDRALPRQTRVLETMAAEGWLTPQELAAARSEQVQLTRGVTTQIAPHFVERVLADVGRNRPRRIQTTLDAALQREIAGIIAAEREALAEHHASNVAIAVLDNHTGEWLAWEGSGRYDDSDGKDAGGKIDGVITPRQPGSALKPFTYAAAFERGIGPAQVLADVPSQFPTAEAGILYSPRNYDGLFRGPLLARAALAGSENVPAVALAHQIGVPTVARLLRRAGFSTLGNNAAHYGLGLTLGNAEVRLDELIGGYAMLARGGQRVTPHRILPTDSGQGDRSASTERVLSERTAFWITDILADAEARSYIFGRGGSLEFPFPVAAKTGTSQSYFDNWVVGYTRDVTVGVWVGNFDRTPLRGSSGVTGAGPLFHAVMLAAVERVNRSRSIDDTTPIIAPPAGLARVEVCATSGMRAGDACPTRVSEWLADTAGNAASCTWHHATDEGLVTVWPDVFRDWARDAGLLRSAPPPPDMPVRISATRAAQARVDPEQRPRLTIVRPLGGAVFMVDPTLRPDFQALTFSARGGAPGSLEWFVDDQRIATTAPDNPVRWPLVPGRHRVVVRDAHGASAETRIEVR